jgi:hypothetical protein
MDPHFFIEFFISVANIDFYLMLILNVDPDPD